MYLMPQKVSNVYGDTLENRNRDVENKAFEHINPNDSIGIHEYKPKREKILNEWINLTRCAQKGTVYDI